MRVDRAFGIVDLSGFTSFSVVHGDEEAVNILARFRAATRDIASRRGIRVAKWLGDGALLVGVEYDALVAAVLELEQRTDDEESPLALRAGVTAGRVIPFEGEDYIGSPVNLASRLCDVAHSCEVLAGIELLPSIPPWAQASAVESMTIKGFTQPVEVIRLSQKSNHRSTVTDPICGMRLPADGVVAARAVPSQGVVSFCSDSCAAIWDGRLATMAEGT